MVRVKTVEYDPGWGWIARNPYTGEEIMEPGFRWNSRQTARSVVAEAIDMHNSDNCRQSCECPNCNPH